MSTMLVVGSGPSGVHLAQTLLELGHVVTMLDVGHERPRPALPEADFDGLKTGLDDPADYFLGEGGEAIVFPSARTRYYAFPPTKDYVFRTPAGFASSNTGFEPAISFATGGLAEAWTGGSYPLNDAELADFPFGLETLAPYYTRVLKRIGVSAQRDDLEKFSAWFADYMDALEPDPHSASLLRRYDQQRAQVNALGFYLGRSRVAVLSRDLGERKACAYLGRCMLGCPRQSLYAASSTLRELRAHSRFRYVQGAFVTHFTFDANALTGVVARLPDGTEQTYTAERYALAAGALCSSKIVLDSIYRATGRVLELGGLMDNRQVMMPFISPAMLGREARTHSYQFHQLALGIARPRPEEYIHGQITALKAAAVHPVVQNLPLDLRSGLAVFRQAHAALAVANVWLPDRRNPANVITVKPRPGTTDTELSIRYQSNDQDQVREAMGIVKRALQKLGCVLPPGMSKALPSGASVHYAGTLPMSRVEAPLTCAADCRSHDFNNLYYADGVTFPFLPAKNLTFTLMANAIRVGESMGNL